MTFRALPAVFVALVCAGCAQPAPRAIVLPTATAVHARIVAIQSSVAKLDASHAREAKLAQQAATVGIRAGSEEAKELADASGQETVEVATLKLQVVALNQANDQLTIQLLATQKKVDGQTSQLAYITTKYNEAVKTIWWYRTHFLIPLIIAAVLLGATAAVIMLAKFTSWGAKTFGPYLVDAEHLAVEAAVHA